MSKTTLERVNEAINAGLNSNGTKYGGIYAIASAAPVMMGYNPPIQALLPATAFKVYENALKPIFGDNIPNARQVIFTLAATIAVGSFVIDATKDIIETGKVNQREARMSDEDKEKVDTIIDNAITEYEGKLSEAKAIIAKYSK